MDLLTHFGLHYVRKLVRTDRRLVAVDLFPTLDGFGLNRSDLVFSALADTGSHLDLVNKIIIVM